MAEEFVPGWEIVEEVKRPRISGWLSALAQTLMLYHPPVVAVPVTFVLRNTMTGETRCVTASSIEEAQIRVLQQKFD